MIRERPGYNLAMYACALRCAWILAALQLGIGGLSAAQDLPLATEETQVAEEPPEQVPEYQIEFLAFAYHAFDPSEEQFEDQRRPSSLGRFAPAVAPLRVDEPPVLTERLIASLLSLDPPATGEALTEILEDETLSGTLAAISAGDAPENIPAEEEVFWFRLLTAEELELTDAYETLARLDAYTPLAHGGWVQQGLPEERAQPFQLSLLGASNPTGTIRLHVSRFLHLTVDLSYWIRQPAPAAETPDTMSYTLEELKLPPRYHLSAQRRTRRGELHYFDHPAFGVLVVIRPQPQQPEDPAEIPHPAA